MWGSRLFSQWGKILVKVRGSAPSRMRYACGGLFWFISAIQSEMIHFKNSSVASLPGSSSWSHLLFLHPSYLCNIAALSAWHTFSRDARGSRLRSSLFAQADLSATSRPPDDCQAGTRLAGRQRGKVGNKVELNYIVFDTDGFLGGRGRKDTEKEKGKQ